jgi:phosphoglycolate phosphatase
VSDRAALSPRLVIFDCDGTLVDSQHIIVEAMTRALAGEGLAVPGRAAILGVVGLSLEVAIARLMPGEAESRVRRVAEGYRAAFGVLRADPAHYEPLYPGIAESLAALGGRDDIVLGIATGKSRRGVDRLLCRFGLERHFLTIQTADDHPSKPHPAMIRAALAEAEVAPAAAVMVGDTTFDMEMARRAGVGAIGVAWGYHPVAELARAGAGLIVARGADLLAAIDGAQAMDGGGR